MNVLKKWRVIESGQESAEWNMAVDEALLNNFKENDLPILRLYGWKRALSVGRFGHLDKSVDKKQLKKVGISCVRRMTGGGVLVHGQDLSYALFLPRTSLDKTGVKESYRYLCTFLIDLYEKLGLDAGFVSDQKIEQSSSEVCLAGKEAYDIVIEGKKMGGNAQRYTRDVLFQHGSIPLAVEREFFEPLFLDDSGLNDAGSLERFECFLGYDELSTVIKEVFATCFNTELVLDTLHPLEEQRARELLAEKYNQQRWNIDAEQDLEKA